MDAEVKAAFNVVNKKCDNLWALLSGEIDNHVSLPWVVKATTQSIVTAPAQGAGVTSGLTPEQLADVVRKTLVEMIEHGIAESMDTQ